MGVVVGSIFGCRGADAEQESTSDGKRARSVGLWAVYASAASTTQWNTPLTRLAGAVGRLLISAEDGMGEGVPPSYSALSGLCVNGAVWSVRICWVEVLWNEFNGRERLQPGLSVDGCDQKQRLGRRSWTFRRSGVLCAKDATSVGTGRGSSFPQRGGAPTGRHDKRRHCIYCRVVASRSKQRRS